MDNKKILSLLNQLSIFDLPISVYATTRQGDFVKCNRPGRELLGLGDKDPITTPIHSIYLDPKQRERLIEKTLSMEAEDKYLADEPISFEKDGREINVMDYCRSLRDPNTNETLGFIGCLVDITLQYRSSQLFDRLPTGVYHLDENDILTHVNDALVNMFGYTSRSELEGKHVNELYPDTEQPELLKNEVQVNNYIEKWTAELVKKDGETFFASINAFALKSTDGSYLGREGTIIDITEEERYRRNLNVAPVGFYQVEINNDIDTVTYCNEQFAKMFDFQEVKDVIGTNVVDLYDDPEAHPIFIYDLLEKDHEGEHLHGRELNVRSKCGRVFTISVYSRALHDRSGEVIGRTGVVIDITNEVELRERESRLQRDLIRLMSDFGRTLHPFSPTFFMVRQSIDHVLNFLEPVALDLDHTPTVQEADDFITDPVNQLSKTLSNLLKFRESERGTLAFSETQWKLLSDYLQLLIGYREGIKEPEHRLPTVRYLAKEITKICINVRKGIIARDPVRNVCNDANYLERVILYINLLRSRNAILQMDHQVHALRDFITSGHRPEEIKELCWMYDLIKAAILPLNEYAQDENIDIRQIDNCPGARVMVIERDIVRALQNVLHIAIKYSWDPSPTRQRFIRIITERHQDQVFIVFENYGVPITRQEIENRLIFRVGYRGLLSGDRSRIGTGIGLADTLSVIEYHGGDVQVTSRPAVTGVNPSDYTRPFLTQVKMILPLHDIGG